jgi:hypothetical protein
MVVGSRAYGSRHYDTARKATAHGEERGMSLKLRVIR